MKAPQLLFMMVLSFVSLSTFAAWQIARPEAAIPREPFFQAGRQTQTALKPSAYSAKIFPNQYANLGRSAPNYALSISGSLKENIERIMKGYHWKIIWKAPYDYNFDGKVSGSSLANVMQKLLDPFPLQGIMYTSNRTMVIVARNKFTKDNA